MKKLQLIILMLFLSINLFAQNWQPVNKSSVYNFQIDTADYITNTIKIDSVEIIDTDSVFYFNRIMTNCDTCSNNENNYYALKNQPQFLMREMVKKSDSLYIFQDTSEFRIMPRLKFGQSWIYDTENNISAVISYEGETDFFGIADSIKTISLSNGKSITISKNFGIIQFYAQTDYYYNLVGIEGNITLGEHLPNFWDFYNYDVGDVFQRQTYSASWGDGYYGFFRIKKYEILSKEIRNDTITYEISGWTKDIDIEDWGWPNVHYDTIAYTFEDTIIFIDSVNHFTNKTNHEFIDIVEYTELQYVEEPLLDKIKTTKEDNIYSKQCGTFDYYTHPFYHYSNIHADLFERNYYVPDMVVYKYTEGLGLYYDMYYFEMANGDFHMGKVHNGDTIGTIYSDSHFEYWATNINKIETQNTLIYPNPIKNGQNLQIKSDEEVLEYNIYNISGQKVLSGNIYSNEININSLFSGVYILELKTKDKIIREKLIIK